jgi:phenylacetate-CoA ligase
MPTYPRGSLDPDSLSARLQNDPASAWEERGSSAFIQLYNDMIENVPAFGDVHRGIMPVSCTSLDDLKGVPSIDKDTYLRKYALADLSWNGSLGRGAWVFANTSGTTGDPVYFPRQAHQDAQYAVIAEQYLRTNFQIHKKRTLYIIGFALGPWIGGVFTYEALMQIARRGYDLSIFPIGTQKAAVIKAVKDLHKHFDQIIIGAYAPHLKAIIEEGEQAGINWKAIDVGFVNAAESYPEELRDFLHDKVGFPSILTGAVNQYGTVDLGTMATETPLSVLIRRRLVKLKSLNAIFPEARRQPTLAQYIPEMFYFEHLKESLHCSGYSGLPLFRYDLKDYGGIIRYDDMRDRLLDLGIDMERELVEAGLADTLWRLPFVFVYERQEQSVGYFAFYITPDQIKPTLYAATSLKGRITDKFTMHSGYDAAAQARLTIHFEVSKGASAAPGLAAEIREVVHQALMTDSPEYAGIYPSLGDVVKPHIVLHGHESPEFFSAGGKHKWIIR